MDQSSNSDVQSDVQSHAQSYIQSHEQSFEQPDEQSFSLTLYYMFIVGRYFTCNNDYINLMKVCKNYQNIVLMYKYNPISDCRLFKNIQTQHFYQYSDVFYRNRDMFEYVYWLNKCIIKDYLKLIDCSKCKFKNVKVNKMIKYAFNIGYVDNLINLFTNCDLINTLLPLKKAVVVFEYNDIYLGFKLENGLNSEDTVCFINECTVSRGNLITLPHENGMIVINRSIIKSSGNQVVIQLEDHLCNQYNLPLLMNVIDWCVIQFN